MAWCPFCRQEVAAHSGMYCPTCGYQLVASTSSSRRADALAQLAASGDEAGDVQQVQAYPSPDRQLPQPIAPPGTTIVYYQQIVHAPRRTRVQTIELTSKKWKAQMLLSSLLCIVGVVVAMVGASDHGIPREIIGLGVIVLVVGLVWFVFARIGAWREHG